MVSFPVLLFLTAVLLPYCPAHGDENQDFKTLSTTLKEVQKEIVNKHNELRKGVSPTASNMLRMVWSDAAAANAQKWANQCLYQHSDPQSRRTNTSCGENIFMSSYAPSWSDAIQSWYDEYHDFSYGVGKKSPSAVVGHYTQVVWYSSFRVGCAFAYCPKQSLKFFLVCQYCPAGNNVGRLYTPYNRGATCGSCPDHCEDGLCTNSCDYEDNFSNCGDLKKAVTCENSLVKNNCKATCNCENKIY